MTEQIKKEDNTPPASEDQATPQVKPLRPLDEKEVKSVAGGPVIVNEM
jgi:hypothetical protein